MGLSRLIGDGGRVRQCVRRGHVSPSLASLADFPWKRIKQFRRRQRRWRPKPASVRPVHPSVPALQLRRRPGHDEADASDRRSRERQGKVALSLPPSLPHVLPAGLILDGVTALLASPHQDRFYPQMARSGEKHLVTRLIRSKEGGLLDKGNHNETRPSLAHHKRVCPFSDVR